MTTYHKHLWGLLIVSSLYFLAMVGMAFTLGATLQDFIWIPPSLLSTAVFMLGIFAMAAVAVYSRETMKGGLNRQTSERVNSILNEAITARRLLGMVPFLLVSTLAFLALSIGKSLIVHMSGYHFDPALAQLDKLIHGGTYPHEIFIPLVEGLHLTALLNFCYYFWFGVLMVCVWCAAFLEQSQIHRLRFWWTLVVILVGLGFAVAHGLNSVGPIYYADFYQGENPYTEFMEHLRQINATETKLQSFQVSDLLLSLSRDRTIADLNGISAMPSLHVALAFLFFLYLKPFGKWVGGAAFGFLMAIFVGSVYFAWHYAVDGYAGILGTGLIWWAVGKLLNRKGRADLS